MTEIATEDIKSRIYDIVEIQRRTPRIYSTMEQRSIKISGQLAVSHSMTISEIQRCGGYKYYSSALKMANRLCSSFPEKYEIVEGNNRYSSTILRIKPDYQRTGLAYRLSYIP